MKNLKILLLAASLIIVNSVLAMESEKQYGVEPVIEEEGIVEEYTKKPSSEVQEMLFKGIYTKNPKMVNDAIAQGADVNAREELTGNTPLIFALGTSTPEIIEFLLKNGADVNANDRVGNTPLIIATQAYHPQIDILKLLVQYGANLNARNKQGKSALDIAFERREAIRKQQYSQSTWRNLWAKPEIHEHLLFPAYEYLSEVALNTEKSREEIKAPKKPGVEEDWVILEEEEPQKFEPNILEAPDYPEIPTT